MVSGEGCQPSLVDFEQVFEAMIPVVDSGMTHINERFDSAERQSGAIQKASEDTLLRQRILTGKYFLGRAPALTLIKHFGSRLQAGSTTLFTRSLKLTPLHTYWYQLKLIAEEPYWRSSTRRRIKIVPHLEALQRYCVASHSRHAAQRVFDHRTPLLPSYLHRLLTHASQAQR